VSEEPKTPKRRSSVKKVGLAITIFVAALLLLAGGYYGIVFASTPAHLRYPAFEHYHIRTQVIVNGSSVDFSQDKFQESYVTGTCNADITEEPFHFHDEQDQLAHIHWRGVTGGEFLKYYGWNFIGGNNDSLGFRYDQGLTQMQPIPTAGALLPEVSTTSNYYIYVGDKDSYEQKSWNDFLTQDLEVFIGKKSLLNTEEASTFNVFDMFTENAYAHDVPGDDHDKGVLGEKDKAQLEAINNLIGNVVVFAQKDAPSTEQIQARFSNLVSLQDSTCGG
jgi:hypothetical protein